VHRLDAGTTGAMVVAKSERAYTALKRAFKGRIVEKLYSVLVQGHPDPSSGTIDAPIDRHPSSDWKFAVVAGGRPSVTHCEPSTPTVLRRCCRSGSKPDRRTRSGCTWRQFDRRILIRRIKADLRAPLYQCGESGTGLDDAVTATPRT